jgi:hypothetical protein
MKSVAVLFIICCSSVALAQTSPEPKPKKSITQERIVDLSLIKRNFRPKLTLQAALKLAESYLEKEKINTSAFYLFEVRYTLYGSKEKEPCWRFWWVNETGAAGDYIELIVSTETGSVRRLISM